MRSAPPIYVSSDRGLNVNYLQVLYEINENIEPFFNKGQVIRHLHGRGADTDVKLARLDALWAPQGK